MTPIELQLRKAFQRGMSDATAYSMNLRFVSNPYPPESDVSAEYRKGWKYIQDMNAVEYALGEY